VGQKNEGAAGGSLASGVIFHLQHPRQRFDEAKVSDFD
jgi:hypothetical protein